MSIQNDNKQKFDDLNITRFINIHDDNGNEYLFNQIGYDNTSTGFVASGSTCETDGFIIHFEDVVKDNNYGFDDPILGLQRRNVVCQLYDDLSKLIVTSTLSANKPHILILSDNTITSKLGSSFPTTPPVNGLGSQFYVLPSGMNNEVIEGEVQKTIIGLRNSYLGIPLTFLPSGSSESGIALYHGFIAVNFSGFNYNTDINIPCPIGQQDLYTLILHEALHTLGISSFINESGVSIFNVSGHPDIFSRYDKYLRINSTPLITETIPGDWNYTGGVTSLALNCGGITNINFNGPALTSDPVYSNPTWIQGTNLSHFGCHGTDFMCSASYGIGMGSDYVMNPCNPGGPDFTKRHPNANEVKALCDLGYKFKLVTPTTIEYGAIPSNIYTHSTYTNCINSCMPVGVIDNYTTAHASSITVNFTGATGILWNDFLGRTVGTTVNDLRLINTSSGTYTSTATSFTFTPSSTFSGYAIFSYYPKCPSGSERGILTYVFIKVEPSPLPPCTPTSLCDNLVCFGDFEGIPITSFTNFADFFPNRGIAIGTNSPDLYTLATPTDLEAYVITSTIITSIPAWNRTIPSPFYLPGGCSSPVPSIAPHSGNTMIGMLSMSVNTTAETYTEGIHLKLGHNLEAGSCGYIFRIWVYGLQTCPTPTARLRVLGGTTNPCTATTTAVPSSLVQYDRAPSCGFEGINLAVINLSNSSGWQLYTVTLPDNVALAGISDVLIIGDNSIADPLLFYTTYVYLDDISLEKNCTYTVDVSSFPTEISTCNDGVINLDYLVSLPEANATPITMHLNLPTGFTLESSTGPFPFGTSLDAIIPAGPARIVALHATVRLGGTSILPGDYTISITPTASSNTCISTSAATTVHVIPNPLTITKTADRYRAVDGDIITYTIQVCNTSSLPLSSVVVTDFLPPRLSLVAAPFGTTLIAGVLTFPAFGMAAGSVTIPYCQTIVFKVKVNYPATGFCDPAITIPNCAEAKIISGLSCGSVVGCDMDLIISTAPTGYKIVGSNVGYPTLSSAITAGILPTGLSYTDNIVIDGNFNIDDNYTFNTCQIAARPASRIVVFNNTLTISLGTHIFGACNVLWKGIELNGSATLIMNMDVHIEDALHAVNDKFGYNKMIIDNSVTFTNNFVGIYLNNEYFLAPVDFVSFIGNRNLYAPYPGMSADIYSTEPTPTSLTRGWAGIHAIGPNVLEVGISGSPHINIFEGLANGIVLGNIRATGPDAIITNSTFTDHLAYGYTNFYGNGIFAINKGSVLGGAPPSSLSVTPFDPSIPNFNNCEVSGITGNFYNMNIVQNNLFDCRTSIMATQYANAQIVIKANTIDAIQNRYGIQLNNLTAIPCNIMIVTANTVNIKGTPRTTPRVRTTGIYVNESNNAPLASAVIMNNTINLSYRANYGIHVNNSKGLDVQQNIVNFINDFAPTSLRTYAGIALSNSNAIDLIQNRVNGIDKTHFATSIKPSAFLFAGSNGDFVCNESYDTYYGFKFVGTCSSNFKNNRMENHFDGLLITPTSFIGIQSDKYNEWYGSYDGVAARNMNSAFLAMSASRFFINSSSLPLYPIGSIVSLAGPGWFNSRASTTPNTGCEKTLLISPLVFDEVSSKIAADSIDFGEFDSTLSYQNQKKLYESAIDQGVYSGSEEEDYLINKSATSIGAFETMDANNIDWSTLDSISHGIYDSLYSLKEDKLDALIYLDSIYAGDTILSTDTTYLFVKETITEDIKNINSHLQLLYQSIISTNSSLIEANTDINSSLEISNESEQYLQEYNTIYQATIAADIWEFSPYEQSRLEYIANLCPFIGGEATYLSRGLIHLYNDDIMYDDEDACSSTSYAYRLANPTSNNSTKEIKNIYSSTNNAIYPNPASTNLTIEFENKIVNQIKYVVIEDMLGKAIDQINSINENKIILSVQNFNDGLYQLKIKDKNHNLIFVTKLNITK
ncbi:MAG: T9SS type A sorting domain-containing protein [Bacteroidota bacterium]